MILCCGAFDTPKLLLLSGVGLADHLRGLGIPVVADLPGVGENLLDHPEGVVMWESSRPVPEATSNYYEAGLFARVDADADTPDLMFHFGTQAFRRAHAPERVSDRRASFMRNPERRPGKEPGRRAAPLVGPFGFTAHRLPVLHGPRGATTRGSWSRASGSPAN